MDRKYSQDELMEMLSNVVDPETGVDVVNLGLIYFVSQEEDRVNIRYTLTSPYCPLEEYMHTEIVKQIETSTGLKCEAKLVWEPMWSAEMISEGARLALGI